MKSALKSSLQKSKTTLSFSSNMDSYLNQEKASNSDSYSASVSGRNALQVPGTVRRSRSFGFDSRPFINSSSSICSDFQIDKWPCHVQESVTAAVTGQIWVSCYSEFITFFQQAR